MLRERPKKVIAVFYLIIFSLQLFYPNVALALTSGPTQPEMQKFQPAGASDMVDLFSGDLKYNIPLLDVGGYPVNLSYASGTGIEEEASWVGMGWTLNPGAVNRTMRGLPDDFDGSQGDHITKEYDRKGFKKVGGTVILKPSFMGWEKGSASVKFNVYKDNYYGIGAGIGVGVSNSLAHAGSTLLTAGLDLNSDVRDGATLSPSLSISMGNQAKTDDDYISASLSGTLNYNSRAGLKDFTLSASFSTAMRYKDDDKIKSDGNAELSNQSAVHYYGQAYTPMITNDTKNTGYTFNFDLGPSIFGGYLGLGGAGYVYNEEILNKSTKSPAYGYLNYLKGRDDDNALLDFNREKDGPFIKTTPAIATPVATQDFFMVTGQAGSGQFRPYFNGNYIVYDKQYENKSTNWNVGVTVGGGTSIKLGGRVEKTNSETRTKKWTDDNEYLTNANYQANGKLDELPIYFKKVGEKTAFNREFYDKFGKKTTDKIALQSYNRNNKRVTTAKAQLNAREGEDGAAVNQPFQNNSRDYQNHTFSYLTAAQAATYGLDKKIKSYHTNDLTYDPLDRYDPNDPSDPNNDKTYIRKKHHISEVTVTDDEGKRMVYGIPVYNNTQEEITFSVNPPVNTQEKPDAVDQARKKGLVSYTHTGDNIDYKYGRDNLYSDTKTPGYASSYLLTGILSPDYVDKTGDGISDDDLGTAVKFNYSRASQHYQWRTPFEQNMANYNEGFISDPKDDKGSIVYGDKEVWYLHSIESKTMIAFFETSDREDGLGVVDRHGGMEKSVRQKKLDQIKLYSKADWLKNGSSAVPIKVVHFVYDYSLYPGIPNNTGDPVLDPNTYENTNIKTGKLTLKKVYFTFGSSSRGESNPYEFFYDLRMINEGIDHLPGNPDYFESNDAYTERQIDRWGTYKQSGYNHIVNGQNVLNNSEFPYVPQEDQHTTYSERKLADRLASKWQLNQIVTPTGSIISVEYESDDYGYVQDKRAMQMTFIIDYKKDGTSCDNLADANELVVQLPQPVGSIDEFKKLYLQQADGTLLDKLFYKAFVRLDRTKPDLFKMTGTHNEFVSGYAEIDKGKLDNSPLSGDGLSVTIPIRRLNDDKYNPIAKAAWQMTYDELPQYAHDSYDNSDVADGKAAIYSILVSFGNLREYFTSPDIRAYNRGMASELDKNKSMIRLFNPDHRKIGGGARVRKITISDNWTGMTAGANISSIYGQYYDYTIPGPDGIAVSTGVASYEPATGNEENPFHEPIDYVESVHWSSDKYHYVEKPFCETYFPAASVGYSQVTVIPFGDDFQDNGTPPVDRPTGSIVNEFYTAKDFPTIVDNLPLDAVIQDNSLILRLFTATSINKVALSQGFKIELNDMHGKEKSVKVLNQKGDLVSSTTYQYNVINENAASKELNNEVDVLDEQGNIKESTMVGIDVDFVTDMRESTLESIGKSVGAYWGVVWFGFFVSPYGAVMPSWSETVTHYHSSSAVKVIQKYGILKKVITTQNGSTIEAENLLWDERTGEVVLTKTQNEFDKYTYAFTYPAHMAYKGMSSAFQNLGSVFQNMSIGPNGDVNSFKDYLYPGDELINISENANNKAWVILSSDAHLHLIDQLGNFVTTSGTYLLQRSGHRNLLNASVGTVVLMEDPRVHDATKGYIIQIDDQTKKVLDSKAMEYKDQWSVPIPGILKPSCGTVDPACLRQFFISAMSTIQESSPFLRRGIFSVNTDNNTAATFLDHFNYTNCSVGFIDNNPASSFLYYLPHPHLSIFPYGHYVLQNGDTAQLGNQRVIFDEVGSRFNDLAKSELTEQGLKDSLSSIVATSSGNNYRFCVYQESPCHYVFKELVSCPNSTQASVKEYAVPGYTCNNSTDCQFNILLRFHLEGPLACTDPLNQVINPYYAGILGNWRPFVSYVYTVSREQKPGNPAQLGGTDIRNSGYYSTYTPFWQFQTSDPLLHATDPDSRWVWSNQVVYFDQKSNEIENMDALIRYSSALFGYDQSAAIAVGANARHNEIAFDGFEDYDFDLKSPLEPCPIGRHFDFGLSKQGSDWISSSGKIVSTTAHTGNYSYQISSPVIINRNGEAASPSSQLLEYDYLGQYVLKSNELAKGFAPIAGKKYLLSFWVNDHDNLSPRSNKIKNLTVKINGVDNNVQNIVVPVVEGWKRLELSFVATDNFQIEMDPSATLEIDDFRILPYDGQMNSYVYNSTNMRLMAQLDENNFATFYEYDEEGTPIRVKKETERGIMTLKESRQAFRVR